MSNSQLRLKHPHGLIDGAAQRVDQDLISVKLQHNVRQPPALLPL